jgi:hypothetical protein
MHTLEKGVRSTGGLNGAINVRAEAELGQCVRLMQPMRAFKLEGSSARMMECGDVRNVAARKKNTPCLGQTMNFSSAQAFLTYIFVPFALLPATCISRRVKELFMRTGFFESQTHVFF